MGVLIRGGASPYPRMPYTVYSYNLSLALTLRESTPPNLRTDMADIGQDSVSSHNMNKPTCARVAAMTTVAHNKIEQYSFTAKVNFTLLLPYA